MAGHLWQHCHVTIKACKDDVSMYGAKLQVMQHMRYKVKLYLTLSMLANDLAASH